MIRTTYRSKDLKLGMAKVGYRNIMYFQTGITLRLKKWVRIPIMDGIELRKADTLDKQIKKLMEDK